MSMATLRTTAEATATGTRRISTTGHPNTLAIYALHLLRRYRRSSIFWALGFGLYTVLMVLSYPSFKDSPALDVSSYPKSLREAFNLENLNLIEPYLSSQIFVFAPLVLAFYPITVFAGAIAGAEERGSLDVLLGNPMPRRNLVLATWIAVALAMLGILLILGTTTWAAALAVDVGLSAREAFRAAFNLFPICMAFGSLALVTSAFVRQRAVAIGLPVVVLFLMYLFDVVGKISPSLANLRYGSAFRYYGEAIVDGIPWGGFAVLLIAALVLLTAAIPVFDRRDIFT